MEARSVPDFLQGVNKVSSAVQLRYDVAHSNALPEEVRQRLVRQAGRRMTAEGGVGDRSAAVPNAGAEPPGGHRAAGRVDPPSVGET